MTDNTNGIPLPGALAKDTHDSLDTGKTNSDSSSGDNTIGFLGITIPNKLEFKEELYYVRVQQSLDHN